MIPGGGQHGSGCSEPESGGPARARDSDRRPRRHRRPRRSRLNHEYRGLSRLMTRIYPGPAAGAARRRRRRPRRGRALSPLRVRGLMPVRRARPRRWLLARCSAEAASCPMRRGGGFLPDAARRWRLAGGFCVICRRMYCARILTRLGPGWGSGVKVQVQVSEMSSKMWRIEDECREM